MFRLNLLLLAITVACALGVVTAQDHTRKLFTELQREKERGQAMDVEWGQLQLEQSTWAAPARVEKIAMRKLQMHMPRPGQQGYVVITEGYKGSAATQP